MVHFIFPTLLLSAHLLTRVIASPENPVPMSILGNVPAFSGSKISDPHLHPICRMQCFFDDQCVVMDFDHVKYPCACPCQVCPNGHIYGQGPDYLRATPVNPRSCPHK